MSRLVYKSSQGSIGICCPAAKADINSDLLRYGRAAWIAAHEQAKTVDKSDVHDRRIAWANSVVDFGNLTDAEYQGLIACDIPSDAQYQYWMDTIPTVDAFFPAWSDIDQKGNVSYNMTTAKAVADAQLKNEMQAYMNEQALLTQMGRDTTAVQASMSDCKARVAKLDAMVMPAGSDLPTLTTLKSLIKENANASQ